VLPLHQGTIELTTLRRTSLRVKTGDSRDFHLLSPLSPVPSDTSHAVKFAEQAGPSWNRRIASSQAAFDAHSRDACATTVAPAHSPRQMFASSSLLG
jgi:hypothetical protein